MAAERRARSDATSHVIAWRLDSSWVLLPGVPFFDGLSAESSAPPVLFVKESF